VTDTGADSSLSILREGALWSAVLCAGLVWWLRRAARNPRDVLQARESVRRPGVWRWGGEVALAAAAAALLAFWTVAQGSGLGVAIGDVWDAYGAPWTVLPAVMGLAALVVLGALGRHWWLRRPGR
jgi:hypothetical protein